MLQVPPVHRGFDPRDAIKSPDNSLPNRPRLDGSVDAFCIGRFSIDFGLDNQPRKQKLSIFPGMGLFDARKNLSKHIPHGRAGGSELRVSRLRNPPRGWHRGFHTLGQPQGAERRASRLSCIAVAAAVGRLADNHRTQGASEVSRAQRPRPRSRKRVGSGSGNMV